MIDRNIAMMIAIAILAIIIIILVALLLNAKRDIILYRNLLDRIVRKLLDGGEVLSGFPCDNKIEKQWYSTNRSAFAYIAKWLNTGYAINMVRRYKDDELDHPGMYERGYGNSYSGRREFAEDLQNYFAHSALPGTLSLQLVNIPISDIKEDLERLLAEYQAEESENIQSLISDFDSE